MTTGEDFGVDLGRSTPSASCVEVDCLEGMEDWDCREGVEGLAAGPAHPLELTDKNFVASKDTARTMAHRSGRRELGPPLTRDVRKLLLGPVLVVPPTTNLLDAICLQCAVSSLHREILPAYITITPCSSLSIDMGT